MKKQEIEHKLEQAKADKFEINKQVQILERQLREAEKPKLRHGDFGYFREEATPRLVVKNKVYDDRGICGNLDYDICYTILGNIFDLLKEWSEPLEYFEFDVHRCEINTKEFPHAPIGFAGNWHTLPEIEEIWHNLGRVIAEFKRKQST